MGSQDEVVTVVDEEDRVVGEATRAQMRTDRLWHRAAYVLVFDRDGRLFVHRRTETKDVYPGFLDVAAGGVVLEAETYEACAERELAEELGVAGVTLTRLFDFAHQDEDNRVRGRAFTCRWDGPVRLQAEEVSWGGFLPLGEVEALAGREPFTPDGLALLRRFLTELPHGVP